MQRRHDLDWVRVCAFGLLVLYHVGMYYVTWDWHVKSPAASEALEPFMLLTSPWRMSLLFVISGVATAFLLRRANAAARPGFLEQRSWRLLLPLLFGMYVVVPPQLYLELVEKVPGGYHTDYAIFMATYLRGGDFHCTAPHDCMDAPTWNHLWFLAYLWAYTVVLWLLLKLATRPMQAVGGWLERRLSGIGVLLWPVLWLALATAVAGYAMLAGVWYFAGYNDDTPPPDTLRMTLRVAWAINQWCAIAAVFGFAYRWRNADSALLRYLTPAVFPVYVLHQTVIVLLAWNLRSAALPPLLEGLLLVVATFTLCLAGYEVIRRVGWLRPLFGMTRTQPAALSHCIRSRQPD
jgi:surface polysaccharide O-acyltransferase-like enzyme